MTEQEEVEFYGSDAAEWLRRWDAGQSVWSVEMGGLGPGYEQCIQITAAEILRHLLDRKYNSLTNEARAEIEKATENNPTIRALGLSGAQWGAAMHLAAKLYHDGPRGVAKNPQVKDRLIQVERTFPLPEGR